MIYFNGIKGKNYFEGWFFRVSAGEFNCSFIPSVSVCGGEKKAYIQVNCKQFSKKFEFDFADFHADDHEVTIGGNRFSDAGIYFSCEDLTLNAQFGAFLPIKKDIMGCFKFGTPCKHKIISMKHTVIAGSALFHGESVPLENAVCYLEKDWGNSFPKAYCWLQSNHFDGVGVSFFCSVAKIGFPFLGLICVLLINGKEYRFATYNFARIKKLRRGEIILKKHRTTLEITFSESNPNALLAPKRGKMQTMIKEDLNGEITLRLFEKGKLLRCINGKRAGIEWVDL